MAIPSLPVILQILRATLGLIAAHISFYLPITKDILIFPSLGFFIAVATVVFTGAKPIGKFIDSGAILCGALGIGALGGYCISLVNGSGTVAVAAVASVFYLIFATMRGINPLRYFAFTIIGSVTVTNSIIASLNAYPSKAYPELTIRTVLAFSIGYGIGLVINLLIFPVTSRFVLLKFIDEWISEIQQFSELVIDSYFANDSELTSKMETRNVILGKLKQRNVDVDLMLNDVASEPYFGKFAPKVLIMLIGHIKRLSDSAMFLHCSEMSHRSWGMLRTVTERNIQFAPVGKQLVSELSNHFKDIRDKLQSGKETSLSNKTLISIIYSFRRQLSTDLVEFNKKMDAKPKCSDDWGESVISVYHFSLSIEELCKEVSGLSSFSSKSLSGRGTIYIPLIKWLPVNLTQLFISKLKSIYKPSFSARTRDFWNTYGLTGGLILLLVVLSPNMGGSYMTAVLEIGGVLVGSTLAMVAFYICGNNVYVLWIPTLLAGFVGFYVMFTLPRMTVAAILLMLFYSSVCLQCWSQQFNPLPIPYWLIYCRTLVVLSLGISIGVVFNLIVAPVFAKHELGHQNSHALEKVESILTSMFSKLGLVTPDGDVEEMKMLVQAIQRDLASCLGSVLLLERELFQRRQMVIQASMEPDVGSTFSVQKEMRFLDKLELILHCLKGALKTFSTPWFSHGQLSPAMKESTEQRAELASTISMLLQLYQGSLRTGRSLPRKLPKASVVRDGLSFVVLAPYIQNHPVIVDIEDEDIAWNASNQERQGLSDSYSVLFYAYVNWMRLLMGHIDELATYLPLQ